MAFLPAGEEDDYDSDDGFIDNEPFQQTESEKRSEPDLNRNSEHTHGTFRDDSTGAMFSRVSENMHERLPKSAAVAKVAFSPGFLSMDDFKMAVIKGNTQVVEKCLSKGLPINEPLRSGWTVLMYAAHYAKTDLVRLLLNKGADPKHHSGDMFTVLMCASASCSHNEEHVRECVQILIEAGSDVNAMDRYHTTPLMFASKDGHLLAVRELLKCGAQVDRQDSRGWTALTWATQQLAKDIVVELLQAGADPDIRHSDKLTVKDLAAHLPNDELLAILERRPTCLGDGSGDKVFTSGKIVSHGSGNYQTTDGIKCKDMKYGELEVFLMGLGLSHLLETLQHQLIDFSLLLTLTEEDLIKAGIDQLGARKKLVAAIDALHRKEWQPSSLVPIHSNRILRCSDAVAIIANSSRHVRYIGSTVLYIRQQFRLRPEQMTQPTDKVTAKQLIMDTEDAIKNVTNLKKELEIFRTDLLKEVKNKQLDAPDLVTAESVESLKNTHQKQFVYCILAFGLCTSAYVWFTRDSLHQYWKHICDSLGIKV